MFKEFFNKNTNKKQRANMWTFQRLIIPIITLVTSLIGISCGSALLLIISSLLIGYGGITDYFDGRAARKYNSTSNYGKILDQITDKIFAGVTCINIIIINPIYIGIIIMELGIAGVNVFYKKKYPAISDKSYLVGRIKQWPLFMCLFLGFLSPINEVFNTITTITVAITLLFQSVTLTEYTISKYKQANKIDKNINNKIANNDYINKNTKQRTKIISYNKSITDKKYKIKVKKKNYK